MKLVAVQARAILREILSWFEVLVNVLSLAEAKEKAAANQ